MEQGESDTVAEFMAALRVVKHTAKEKRSLQAIAIITNWAGAYLHETTGGSPFNVDKPIAAPYFTLEEVSDLFQQFATQEGTPQLDPRISKITWEFTAGAPGLTNIFGLLLADMHSKSQKIPTVDEWNQTLSSEAVYQFANAFTNITMIKDFLFAQTNEARDVQQALVHAIKTKDVKMVSFTPQVENELQKRNITRKTDQFTTQFASPFIQWFVIRSILPRKSVKLNSIPMSNGQIDFLQLVVTVVKNMHTAHLLMAPTKDNKCKLNCGVGLVEEGYRMEFRRACFKTTSTMIYTPEEPVQIQKGNRSVTLRCDSVIKLPVGTIAVEHCANVSLTETATTHDSLWHHVYEQGEKYAALLKPNQTWVIHWTTVPESSLRSGYYFPKSTTVQTMHIYHDEFFQKFIIRVEDKNKTIEVLTAPVKLGKRKRGTLIQLILGRLTFICFFLDADEGKYTSC